MSPRLLLIDNYDSFTYNLVQAFMILGAEVLVYRNDALDLLHHFGSDTVAGKKQQLVRRHIKCLV